MPFDCTPIIEKQVSAAAGGIGINYGNPEPVRSRLIPPWYVSRQPECVDASVAVLSRARELISDERRWCKRAFTVTWLDIPVHALAPAEPIQSFINATRLASQRQADLALTFGLFYRERGQ